MSLKARFTINGSEKFLKALAFRAVRCSILRFIFSKQILSDSLGQQFFIVQSFLTRFLSILPVQVLKLFIQSLRKYNHHYLTWREVQSRSQELCNPVTFMLKHEVSNGHVKGVIRVYFNLHGAKSKPWATIVRIVASKV